MSEYEFLKSQKDDMVRRADQRKFVAMLERAGIGHSLRTDAGGDTVLVESGTEGGMDNMVTEFTFNDGRLIGVQCYPGM